MHFLQFGMVVTFNFLKLVKLPKFIKSHSMRKWVIPWKRLVIICGLEWKLHCLPKRGNEADVSRFARRGWSRRSCNRILISSRMWPLNYSLRGTRIDTIFRLHVRLISSLCFVAFRLRRITGGGTCRIRW